jgi:vancomycin permeability regulator SanA
MFIRCIKLLIVLFFLSTGPFQAFNLIAFTTPKPQESASIAMVLGAGIVSNQIPSGVLRERLDTAIDLYQKGTVQQILVTGDNRAFDYDEPKVMRNYLLSKNIPDNRITQDFAGRRTYDSCWRAKNVFKVDKVVLITQGFHMPRTAYLCKSVGLQVELAIAPDPRKLTNITGLIRELPACWLALQQSLTGYEPEVQSDGNEKDLSNTFDSFYIE